MTAPRDLTCPVCAAELSIEQLFASEETRSAFGLLATISIPLGSRVLAYLTLFAPAKNRLTIARKVKMIEELLPDLKRQVITRNGRDWSAPLAAWSLAIDGMLVARDQGKLQLPLSGHGYLYAMLQGMADKVERSDEQRREAERRTPSTAASYQVRGQAMPMGQALAQVFGGQDPALAKLDADDKVVAPMPQAARDQLAALKRNKPTT